MRLRKRILLIYLAVIVCFQLITALATETYFDRQITHIIQNDYRRNFYFLDHYVSEFLRNVERDLEALANHPYVRIRKDDDFTSFLEADEETFEYSYTPEELRIIELFNTYRTSHPYVNSVYMGRENGTFVRSHQRNRSTRYDPRIRPWYTLAIENPGQILRTDVYPSVTSTDLNIGTVKALTDDETSFGVVGIDVTLSNLNDYAEEFHFSYDLYSEIFILDSQGYVILSNQPAYLNNDFGNLFPGISEELKNGSFDRIIENSAEQAYYYFIESECLGWQLGGIIPFSAIRSRVNTFTFRILFWEMGAILLLGGIILLVSDISIVNRLQILHDDVLLMKSGSFHRDSAVYRRKDEIGQLGSSFMKVYSDLKRSSDELQRSNRILKQNQSETIYCLATLAETRDPETGSHIIRTQHYVRAIALRLRSLEQYRDILTDELIETLFQVAPLHDIGKVGVPDRILMKPGKLTEEEFETMKEHTTLGYRSLRSASHSHGSSSFFSLAADLAWTHHERWDGTGYPRGLTGSEIPLAGRIMALADIYDALTTVRVYKPAFSHDKTRKIILESRETQLDPDVVDAFLEAEEEFITIAELHREPE